MDVREEIPAIRKLLKDSQPGTRMAAIAALHDLGAKELLADLGPLLQDQELFVQEAAIRAAGTFGFKDGVPRLIEIVREHGQLSARALEALVRMEPDYLRAEVGSILKGEFNGSIDSMVLLNALRRPREWEKLMMKDPGGGKGSNCEIVDRVAKKVGMSVEWPQEPSEILERWKRCHGTVLLSHEWSLDITVRDIPIPDQVARPTYWDALATPTDGLYQVILESDRIKILPRSEAHVVWNAWWKEESEKKR
jgi:hypothetical protein